MNRNQRRTNKKQLEVVKAILETTDTKEAEAALEFAVEVNRKYGNLLADTIGVIADLKAGCPDHNIDWLINQVRTGLAERTAAKHSGTIEELRKAGISQPVAESLAVEIERLEADLREIALQLGEDTE